MFANQEEQNAFVSEMTKRAVVEALTKIQEIHGYAHTIVPLNPAIFTGLVALDLLGAMLTAMKGEGPKSIPPDPAGRAALAQAMKEMLDREAL